MSQGSSDEQWHVGKEIPIALIVTLAISVMSGIWYASKSDARITTLEEFVKTQTTLREDIVQIREQLRNLDRLTQRLEEYLDRRGQIDLRKDGTIITEKTDLDPKLR